MKKFITPIALFTICFAFQNCSKSPVIQPPPPNTCNTTNTAFQNYFNSLASNTALYTVSDANPFSIHEYTFVTNANVNICAFGYQSQPALSSQQYKIELIRKFTNAVIYSNNSTFSTSAASYFNPPAVIALAANDTMILRRTVLNNLGTASNSIGKVVKKINNTPITHPGGYVNGIHIYSSKFYNVAGSPMPANDDMGLPFIDFR